MISNEVKIDGTQLSIYLKQKVNSELISDIDIFIK